MVSKGCSMPTPFAGLGSVGWRRVLTGASAALILALPTLSWGQAPSVDLAANISGPSTSAAGAPFTYTVTLTNNGPWGADGATFSTMMPANATNVAAICTAADKGATCPTGLTTSNTEVSGVIPSFPNQGKVVITITGTYGVPSPTSVTSTVQIDPPAGITETQPITNNSTVNTNLITDAKLRVSKTQSGGISSEVIYTITLVNDGNAAADGARITDYLYSSGAPSAASQATVNASFVSCTASGGAQCPADSQFGNFSGIKGTTSRYLFDTTVPQLPSGGSLTVVYRAAVTPETDTCGLYTSNLSNYATITPPTGITNQFGTPSTYANLSVQGTAACPTTSAWPYSLTKTQEPSASSFAYGQPITYTIKVVNNSTEPADGALLRDWVTTPSTSSSSYNATLAGRFLSCVAANGAECPADSTFSNVNYSVIGNRQLFNVSIPKFPAGGEITVQYQVTLTETTRCDRTAGYFRNYASISAPAGFIGLAAGPVAVNLPATTPCPLADIQLTKTQSTPAATPGVPFEYEINVTNKGPESADGASWYDYIGSGSGFIAGMKAKIEFIACEATNGAECPARDRFAEWPTTPVQLNTSRYLVRGGTTIPKLPVDGNIRLRYRVTLEPLEAASCSTQTATLYNYTGVTPVAPTVGSRTANANMLLTCADIGVSKSVDPIVLKAGEPVTYTVTVANSGLGPARDVRFIDPLPSIFEFESATCEMVKESVPTNHPRTECGPTVDYDPASHQLTSTIKAIGQLGEVQFTIKGKAGSVAGTYTNEAIALLPPGLIDPIMASNRTDVNVQISNTQSPITVAKQVAGLPASGLPVDMSFTGTVTCGAQPAQNWSITVPAGAVSGMSAPLTFYDTEVCTVTEDAPPAPPAGYVWDGTPTITNPTTPLGPSTPLTVPVVNQLRRLTAEVILGKQISGPSADLVQQVSGTFSFELSCGNDGTFNQDVVIAAGAANSATVTVPTGASCQVTETAMANAPAGFRWEQPVYDSNPVQAPSDEGGTVNVSVTNTLRADVAPPPTPVPTLSLPWLALLAGIVGVIGAWRRRR